MHTRHYTYYTVYIHPSNLPPYLAALGDAFGALSLKLRLGLLVALVPQRGDDVVRLAELLATQVER
jgi:hypothetical protein